ncbi:MAG: hypothetical protein KGH60_01030 [Candidatus Micrarchaeota archaeon]|nr:hypothetical protein [Candidatus Micrarchaeota archaeon]
MGEKQTERQLCNIIDGRIGRMNKALQMSLSDEKQIDRRISDVGLRNDLISVMDELIEVRKLAERLKEEDLIDKTYAMRIEISADRLKTVSYGYM